MLKLKDIAEKTGFSINTVSKTLNNKAGVNKDTRKLIIDVANELNYIPNALARSMVLKKTNLIGLIVADISDPFYSNLTKVVEDYIFSNNYKLILANTNEDSERETRIINILRQQKVDGMIIIPTQQSIDIFKELVKADYPFVLINRVFDSIKADSVQANHEKGLFDVTNYFCKYNRKRIGLLNVIENTNSAKLRLIGYKKCLKYNNLSYDESLVKHFLPNRQSIINSIEELLRLEPKVDAIFCGNYHSTTLLLRIIRERKINVPDDLSIIGFEEENLAENTFPPLTTLSLDIKEIGGEAVKILFKKIEQPNSTTTKKIIDCKIKPRKSCGE